MVMLSSDLESIEKSVDNSQAIQCAKFDLTKHDISEETRKIISLASFKYETIQIAIRWISIILIIGFLTTLLT